MTDFEKTYQNYTPRQTALDEARALLTAAAKAAMADGPLPEAELPAFIVELPAAVKNGATVINLPDTVGYTTPDEMRKLIKDVMATSPPTSPWPARAPGARPRR